MEKQPVQKKDMHVLFLGMQETMISKLEWARKNIPHSGEKGAAAEVEWIAWLREFLPKRYSVDKGFVIAHDGTLSDQIDIIIYDRVFSPLAFICEDVKYIPVESVYAVIEVKQELKGNCQYAGEKAASVRRLPRKVIPQVRNDIGTVL